MVAIVPQSDIFAERIIALGAKEEAIFPSLNLKALYRPIETPLPDAIKDMAKHDWLLAAATHVGEEEIILDAFQRAHQTEPELRLIIAPRHPERGDEVAKLARNAFFTVASRSSNDQPNAQIYIADTLHEMHLWYQICAKVFVGGSLVSKGGHTPYEPSAYGCWIIHGPFVSNFEDAYQEFKSRKMCEQIEDAATLSQAFLNTPTFSNEQVTFENSRSGEAELVFQRLEKIMHISG
jgi:3-deoxy-D-manno-octulosonic-acid transferase